jgi:hypothetical protein
MADKFVRTLIYNNGVANSAKASTIMKMIYEFWGFCINGTSSLVNAGGFASTTPSTMPGNFNGVQTTIAGGSNGQTLPQAVIAVNNTTGFPTGGTNTIYIATSTGTQTVTYTGTTIGTFTGCLGGTGVMSTGGSVTSSSLITLGSDGYTNPSTTFRYDGYTPFFAPSGPFTANMVGKALTAWVAGSTSSEDAVYLITSFISPTEITIDINNGGVPSAANSNKPSTVGRNPINYRVTDINIAASATADGNYFVLQLNPVNVNVGQANSQVQLTQGAASGNLNITAVMSPGGTWNGAAFTDGTSIINSGNLIANANGTGRFEINMWGDIDYLIFENTWESQSGSCSMHLEIPTRLYPQANDPNPITMCLNAQFIPKFFTSSNVIGWSGGFYMKCNDGVTRTHRTLVKSLIGDGKANDTLPNVANPPGNILTDFRPGANPVTGNLLNSNMVLCLPGVAGQYSLARVMLRKARIANAFMPFMYRFTSNGNFILLQQGLALPWDNTVLPYTIIPF